MRTMAKNGFTRWLPLALALLSSAQAAPPAVIKSLRVRLIAPLTGPDATTPTRDADICGTDLGIPASLHGTLYLAFGDTFGYSGDECPRFGPNWRSNVLGWSNDRDLADGLSWSGWHSGPDGTAVAVVEGQHQPAFSGDDGEQTRIPTALIGLGNQLVMHTMSVHGFAAQGGVWSCNFSQFVTSADGGKSWQPKGGHVGEKDSNFNMLALSADAGTGNPGGQYVYVMGTPCGRFDDAKLARVPADRLTDLSAWRYYAGRSKQGAPLWAKTPQQAVAVVKGPVGEASLSWNGYLKRWTYSYLNEHAAALELREAVTPWGPWSAPHVLVRGSDYPQVYGAFSTSAMQRDGGKTVYFVISRFGPYNTYLMRADLSK